MKTVAKFLLGIFLFFCFSFLSTGKVLAGTTYGSCSAANCSSAATPVACYTSLCPGACGNYDPGRYAAPGAPFTVCTNVCGAPNRNVSMCDWWNGCCVVCAGCSICAPDDNNWSACSASCGPGTQSNGCGRTQNCNLGPCCSDTNPASPTLGGPANGAQIRINQSTNFTWSTSDWGTNCGGNNNYYELNIPGTPAVNWSNQGGGTSTNWTPTAGKASVTWSVRANNGARSSTSSKSFCVEAGAVIGAWGNCNAAHIRTRTCSENCGADDCAGVTKSQNCIGEIRGTIFDASDYASCPGYDANGYLMGLAGGLGARNRTFGLSGPWALLSPATTNSSGNYATQVYAPGTYTYDFSGLSDIYMTASIKLTCEAANAVVPAWQVPVKPPAAECTTQPCQIIKNMSFGFWKIYDGWWQAVGGNIHGDTGIQSIIPSSLATEMSLILPDATAGNRRGFVSYGVPRSATMLGLNPNAKVSTSLWEKESQYGGQIYDWNFYNTRFKKFATTAWADGVPIAYNDLGVGYQIFQSPGSISAFSFNPTGVQKAIFHVAGDVNINSDIVVPTNAFLTVIASGTITFATNVTRADGWYIAGNISIPCKDPGNDGCDKNDSQFTGNGSFIAWNGFSIARTRGVINNTSPSEKFTYRQDLYKNAPEPMKIYLKYFKPFVP